MTALGDKTDTIAAVATPLGQGGIGVVRVSGPLAGPIGQRLCGKPLSPRQAHYTSFRDRQGELIDAGIGLYFPGPGSFTGEDVLELQGHGGAVVMDMLLRECVVAGARHAEPGEFSLRAFLNDKLDLAQAEAIADLINATTEAGVRSANRSLQGKFSSEINALMASVVELRVYVEAAIDFPEEEIDFIQQGQVAERLQDIHRHIKQVQETAQQGKILRDGMKLVIAGRPNAGKSSLLNALSGEESAIVTAIEGTTRDVLREHIQIDGMPLHIVDTAGLRDSDDLVEREGIKRAWHEIDTADHVLLVVDDANPQDREAGFDTLWPELNRRLGAAVPVTIIHNKCDITGNTPALDAVSHRNSSADAVSTTTILTLSAKTGAGLDLLRSHLKSAMGYANEQGQAFMARQRHLDALHSASSALAQGMDQLTEHGAGELLAEDLRHCHETLGTITGAMSADELLGEIFSSFCIGK